MRAAFFLDSKAGGIFCWGYLHAQPSGSPHRILIVPPFAEEMNKSRHVLAALAAEAAVPGHEVLMPDLFGTGDSEGDFADASLDVWRADLDAAIARFGHDGPLHIVGMRAGALLAADAAQRHPVARLILIQPQTEGRQVLTQFLRLRLAAGLSGAGEKETTAGLRRRLADGERLEIAGYRLSGTLAAGLESLGLQQLTPLSVGSVAWIELAPESGRAVMPGSQRVIDAWRKEGVQVDARVLVCDQFWATQEIARCPALIDEAATLLTAG